MEHSDDKKEILVWDRATRAFHWILVGMVAICWLTSEAEGALFWTHTVSGYAIVLLVFFGLYGALRVAGMPGSKILFAVGPRSATMRCVCWP